ARRSAPARQRNRKRATTPRATRRGHAPALPKPPSCCWTPVSRPLRHGLLPPNCGQSSDHPHHLFGLNLGGEIGRQQGQKRRITTLKSNRKSGRGLLVARAGAFAPSDPDKPCHRRRQQRHDDGIEAVKQAAESRVAVPTRTEHHADISEAETPRPG